MRWLLLVFAALLAVAPPAAAAPGEHQARDGTSARAYWTPARMAAARPAPVPAPGPAPAGREAPAEGPPSFVPPAGAGKAELRRGLAPAASPARARPAAAKLKRREVVDPSAPNVRSHGRVFFTTTTRGGELQGWSCSGTSVNSRNRSVVWTAGHCVFDRAGRKGYVSNWVFVPGYHEGEAPFGRWPARRLAATRQWRRKGNLGFDLGAAVVRKSAGGRRLQGVVGARGIAFDQRRKRRYNAFGYPAAELPAEPGLFTGEREFRCAGKPRGRDLAPGRAPDPMRLRCDMTAGSSGGGWVAHGSVLSVTSYLRDRDPGFVYGPYMSKAAKRLYKSVRGKRQARKKHKRRGGKGKRRSKRITGGVIPARPQR